MKKLLIFFAALLMLVGCTKDFEDFNKNPNDPQIVSTGFIFTYVEKNLIDNLRDEWFGGRCTFSLAQYWAQRNYTDEDRYMHRTDVTNAIWRVFYIDMMNLAEIIRLNTDEATKGDALANGYNDNQIAVAKILTMFILQIATDTWGDVPYTQALQGLVYRTPAFDKQSDLYPLILTELQAAIDMIDLGESGVKSGEIIYGGDMTLWKKFGNSLRLKAALRMKAKDPAPFNAMMAMDPSEFIASNAENAVFKYPGGAPNNGPMYDAWFTEARNDFTIAKPFMDLLKGVSDSLNPNKPNPFLGMIDPRLPIFCTPVDGKYLGMPYGMLDAETKAYAALCPDFKNDPSPVHAPDYGYSLMEYSEVCFIMSEGKNWDQTWYENGIRASMENWGVAGTDIDTYIAAVPDANQETVLTQKYIALYPQPENTWAEYRRTGFPKILLHPGEVTHIGANGAITFVPLEGTDIPRRILYPIEEQGVNTASYNAAVANMGSDDLDVDVWWAKAK